MVDDEHEGLSLIHIGLGRERLLQSLVAFDIVNVVEPAVAKEDELPNIQIEEGESLLIFEFQASLPFKGVIWLRGLDVLKRRCGVRCQVHFVNESCVCSKVHFVHESRL